MPFHPIPWLYNYISHFFGFFSFFLFLFFPLSGVKARIVEESTVERFCFVCVFRHSCWIHLLLFLLSLLCTCESMCVCERERCGEGQRKERELPGWQWSAALENRRLSPTVCSVTPGVSKVLRAGSVQCPHHEPKPPNPPRFPWPQRSPHPSPSAKFASGRHSKKRALTSVWRPGGTVRH